MVAASSVCGARCAAGGCWLVRRVDVLVIAVDDGCEPCRWTCCYSEIVVEVAVASAAYSAFAHSSVVDDWCCGDLSKVAGVCCGLEVLGEVDVPCCLLGIVVRWIRPVVV